MFKNKLFSFFLLSVLLLMNEGYAGASVLSSKYGNNEKSNTGSPPNFVLILVDDLGYGDLGIYGNSDHHTPHMDALAREGMLFTDFYANAPVCSPTRAALMTGQYQQRSGVEHAIGFTMEEGMPLEKVTIAELLQDAGYVSGVFGKWHIGHVTLFGPNDQGFMHSRVSNNTPDYHTHISRVGEYDWYKDHEVKEESGYLTDLVTEHSVRFIHDKKEQPFFLFISHIAVHFPFQGPNDPAHRTPGKIWHHVRLGPLPESQYRRAYREMVESVDQSVGDVVSTLDELGLRENTLVFVTSDNGAYHWVGSNYPLRGQKGDLYEGGIRVPAFANWPGRIASGQISNVQATTMDLAPTFLSLACLSLANEQFFDGVDLKDVLFENADLPHRTLFWRFNNPYTDTRSYAVRDGGWKYLVFEDQRYLFQLDIDITESNNLLTRYPKEAERLEKAYRTWLDDVED